MRRLVQKQAKSAFWGHFRVPNKHYCLINPEISLNILILQISYSLNTSLHALSIFTTRATRTGGVHYYSFAFPPLFFICRQPIPRRIYSLEQLLEASSAGTCTVPLYRYFVNLVFFKLRSNSVDLMKKRCRRQVTWSQ